MEKIHRDSRHRIAVEADAQAKFRGERQDLEEMAGNLVDKRLQMGGPSQLFIEVLFERPVAPGAGPMLRNHRRLTTGAGCRRPKRAQVVAPRPAFGRIQAGLRAGLSIVIDLADLYAAVFRWATPPIGGLRAELVMPGCDRVRFAPEIGRLPPERVRSVPADFVFLNDFLTPALL